MKISVLNQKNIQLLAIMILVFSLTSVAMQNSFAASRTVSVTGDQTTITFRDIESLDPTPEPVISLDKTLYHAGETATVTLDDFNANLDISAVDTTSVLVNSQPVVVTETGANSHVFVGTFKVAGNLALSYSPVPVEAPRAQVTLGVDNPGDVIISDYIIDENELANLSFNPVIHGIDVQVANGATLDGTNAVVTLSYANGNFLEGDSTGLLQMYYRPGPDFGWSVITVSSDPDSNNQDKMTLTSDPETAFIEFPVTTGQYVLGYEIGSGGGGAGGLVRPGLVLNLLAGLNFGAGGPDRTPPSLQYGKPESDQNNFGGILLSDDNKNKFPLVINNKGFYLPEFSNTITPVNTSTGNDVNLTLTFLESTGVQHIAMHFVDQNNDEMSENDPTILYDKDNVTVSDSQGVLSDGMTFSKSKDSTKYTFNFGFSFDKPGNRHLMITAWDDNKNSANTKIFDAFAVSGQEIPKETSHLIYLDLGAFFITPSGILQDGQIITTSQPVIKYDYPDDIGKSERHDGMSDQIESEKTRATQIMSKFNLSPDSQDEIIPLDTRRAPQLTLSHVGHKIRDFTLTPEENKYLIKDLAWKEYLKAQKTLDSMLGLAKQKK